MSCFKSIPVVSSISVITIATSLALSPLTAQKTLAQTAINGVGSTFIDPLYTGSGGWFASYGDPEPEPNVIFNYAARGSDAGITSFLTQTPPSGSPTVPKPISFGTSDTPLRLSSSTPVPTVGSGPNKGPVIQVPIAASAFTLAYNPNGLNVPSSGLRLSRATYCGIFTGAITNWNNSRVTADNGRQIAANAPIEVVRPSDNNAGTFILSNHLNVVCQSTPYKWNRGVGSISVAGNPPASPAANTVYWPSSFISAAGASGVANLIAQKWWRIGIPIPYWLLRQYSPSQLRAASLQNQAGNFIAPSPSSASAALLGATDIDSDPRILTINVPNPTASTAYPLVGVTYQLYYDDYASSSVAAGIRGFTNWALGDPDPQPSVLTPNTIAINRGYAPLPATLKTTVRNIVNTYVDTSPN